MLKITIPSIELWDESTTPHQFVNTKERVLILEHSLISLSKWESKWEKPFLSKDNKTNEETIDYIRCMTINYDGDYDTYKYLTNDNISDVRTYIESEMTATKITNNTKTTNREIITAEIIYYWMIALNIPFECQKWHLNKLLTLINVCSAKNAPSKPMSKKEIMSRNAAVNKSRRDSLNSKG